MDQQNKSQTIATWVLAIAALGSILISLLALNNSNRAQESDNRTSQAAQKANELAGQALDSANKANEIAEEALSISENATTIALRSYELAKREKSPLINAKYEFVYSDNPAQETEKLAVFNDGGGGGEIGQISATAYILTEINLPDKTVIIPINGYFSNSHPTLARQGLIYTFYREGNSGSYNTIAGDFREAAKKDGFDPSIWRYRRILKVKYSAAFLPAENEENIFEEYYEVSSDSYPTLLSKDDAVNLLNNAKESERLANNIGLELYIWQLNGTKLWNWCKTILPK